MPNSKQVSPDPADEVRDPLNPSANNSGNNMEQPEAAAGAGQPVPGPAGVPRRDENSISFRHFLQPHSDVVPAPAPTCRSRNRGTQPGAVDLVDMAMTLPDFVQDHLVVESLAIADHQQNDGGPSQSGASSLDLNVLNEILPDFTTSQSAHSLPSQAGSSRNVRRNIPEEAPAGMDAPHGATGSSALPDFLSDGPMQCTDSNVVDNTLQASSSSRSTSRLISSASLTDRSRLVEDSTRGSSFDSSDTLRSEVDRLRRELLERNRRISQLESEVLRLRSNVNTLENALRTAEQPSGSSSSEARRMEVQRRAGHSSSSARTGGGDACDNVTPSSSGNTIGGAVELVEVNAHAVRNIAQSSEALLSQLLENMNRLQGLLPSSHNDGNTKKSNTDGDESTR